MKRFSTYMISGALVACLVGASLVVAEEKPEYSGFLGDYSNLWGR